MGCCQSDMLPPKVFIIGGKEVQLSTLEQIRFVHVLKRTIAPRLFGVDLPRITWCGIKTLHISPQETCDITNHIVKMVNKARVARGKKPIEKPHFSYPDECPCDHRFDIAPKNSAKHC